MATGNVWSRWECGGTVRDDAELTRIFLSLALVANVVLVSAIVLGMQIGDVTRTDRAVQSAIGVHMLAGLGALTFATLVHAIVLTYFMGTGRWLEETSRAYQLDLRLYQQSQKIKYGTLPGMIVCLLLLIGTGALGAAADPATPVSLDGVLGLKGSTIHLLVALITIFVNLVVSLSQYLAVSGNAAIIEVVLGDVRRIRMERGLPVN